MVKPLNQAIGDGIIICCMNCLVPRKLMNLSHSEDSNCQPRSVVTVVGMPSLDIQLCMKACAIASAMMVLMGIASGHCVNRSIQVRR